MNASSSILERNNFGVLDHAIFDLYGSPDGLAFIPAFGAAHHYGQVGQKTIGDFPGGGIPQIGGCMVYRVVMHLSHFKHGVNKARGFGKVKAHPFIAAYINDQAAWFQPIQASLGYKHQGAIGILQDPIDDDIRIGQFFFKRPGSLIRVE